MLVMLIGFFVFLVAVLVAVASVSFWLLAGLFGAGKRTALAISLITGVLSTPMVVANHGIGFVPLALGMLIGGEVLTPFYLFVPVGAVLTFVALTGVARAMHAVRDRASS